MENQDKAPKNGAAPTSVGSSQAKGTAQGKAQTIKEGRGTQGRPKYGKNAGPNTSSREDQLPALDEHGKQTQ